MARTPEGGPESERSKKQWERFYLLPMHQELLKVNDRVRPLLHEYTLECESEEPKKENMLRIAQVIERELLALMITYQSQIGDEHCPEAFKNVFDMIANAHNILADSTAEEITSGDLRKIVYTPPTNERLQLSVFSKALFEVENALGIGEQE